MAQNIYDSPDFFAAYSCLGRSVRGLDGAPEWPVIRSLLPDLRDRHVVDLGCGFGWFTRWARQAGAASVLGLDLSTNMLARARAETADPAIRYEMTDLETVDLPGSAFDLAYSSLAFHYIQDFARLARSVFDALVSDGYFVFTIEHPIYMAPTSPAWMTAGDGETLWPLNQYAIEGPRTTNWLARGVVKQHRTIATTVNTLIEAGFTLRHLIEWAPTDEQIAMQPSLKQERERPMLLLLAATANRS